MDEEQEYEFLKEVVVVEHEEGEHDQGLSRWEFIDASDADSDSEEDRHLFEEEEEEDRVHHDDEANGSLSCRPSIPLPIPNGHDRIQRRVGVHHLLPLVDLKSPDDYDDDANEEEEEDDEDDSDDGYDLDDELVPWSVSNKFGRQRMRKLGKRAFPKMNNSKRSPYLFVRPGCVRGKHGLGLKHSC
ncbi:hypothetical protein FEM48_Zijuj09G0098900 [Ziziphus jujuba var. spinosa]|nr:hypothetical protein FEM48_Zijuj09G0098900 [Ziziphus jujuba var. spinosa]